MAYISNYNGLKIVLPEPPEGAGGQALNENFKAIANHMVLTNLPHGATSTNTANRIVSRGATGQFSAGAITGTQFSLSGNEYINSANAGHLDINSLTAIDLNQTTNVTGDITGTGDFLMSNSLANINCSGNSLAFGYSKNNGTIISTSSSLSFGYTDGVGSKINSSTGLSFGTSQGIGAEIITVVGLSFGISQNNGSISSGEGAIAHGYVTGYTANNSAIEAGTFGSLSGGKTKTTAYGYYSKISSNGYGSIAHGYAKAENISSYIQTTGNGSLAIGYAKNGSITSETSSMAHGQVIGAGGYITAKNQSLAQGLVNKNSLYFAGSSGILAQGMGGIASGYAKSYDPSAPGAYLPISRIRVHTPATGGIAVGQTYTSYHSAAYIDSNAIGSISSGYAIANSLSPGPGSNSMINAMGVGSFSSGKTETESAAAWMNSAGIGSQANGFVKVVGGSTGSFLNAYASGSKAFGVVLNYGIANSGSRITADFNAFGSMAFGHTQNSDIIASGAGSISGGKAYSPNTGIPSLIVSSGAGSTARGYVDNTYPNSLYSAQISAGAEGSFAMGRAKSTVGSVQIVANGKGSISAGYVVSAQSDYVAEITSLGNGSVAFGDASGGVIRSPGKGSMSVGRAYSNSPDPSYILSTGDGSFACGSSISVDSTPTIKSTGSGSFAHGYATSNGGFVIVDSQGKGSTAIGFAGTLTSEYPYIRAYGEGSLAGGWVNSTANPDLGRVIATGDGSFAWGYSFDGDIVAQTSGSIQFGVGTNDVASSLQVGQTGTNGIRLRMDNLGTANGDIFLANNFVYIRSNGNNVKIV